MNSGWILWSVLSRSGWIGSIGVRHVKFNNCFDKSIYSIIFHLYQILLGLKLSKSKILGILDMFLKQQAKRKHVWHNFVQIQALPYIFNQSIFKFMNNKNIVFINMLQFDQLSGHNNITKILSFKLFKLNNRKNWYVEAIYFGVLEIIISLKMVSDVITYQLAFIVNFLYVPY